MKKILPLAICLLINQLVIASHSEEEVDYSKIPKDIKTVKQEISDYDSCITSFVDLLGKMEKEQQAKQSALQKNDKAEEELRECKTSLEKYKKSRSQEKELEDKNRELNQQLKKCLISQDQSTEEHSKALANQKAELEKECLDAKSALEKLTRQIDTLKKENVTLKTSVPGVEKDRDEALQTITKLQNENKNLNVN